MSERVDLLSEFFVLTIVIFMIVTRKSGIINDKSRKLFPWMLLFIIAILTEGIFGSTITRIVNSVGEWTYYLGFVMLGIVSFYLTNKVLTMDKIIPSIYTSTNTNILTLDHNSRKYYVQIASLVLEDIDHPTLYQFEPLILDKDGSLSRHSRTDKLMGVLIEILDELISDNRLQMMISRIDNPFDGYYSFQVFIYSIYDRSSDSFAPLQQLVMKYDNLSMIDLERVNVDRLIYFNKGKAMINPSVITFRDSSFELGKYEFYVFKELIKDFNRNKIPGSIISGDFSIGNDIYQTPVSIDKPLSTLYLGKAEHIQQIMKFEYYEDCILITDDQDLMCNIDAEQIDIDNLYINIIGMNLDEPRFFKRLISLCEVLIPDSIKPGSRSKQVADKLVEFLELNQLNNPDDEILAEELLSLHPYAEYNKELLADIKSKFSDIFSLSLFNKREADSLITVLNSPGKKIISTTGLENKSKLAVVILLLVLKDQYLLRNQLLISVPSIDLESHLRKIMLELDLNGSLIHLKGIQQNSQLSSYFELILADAGIGGLDNEFAGLHNARRGIRMSYESRDKAILEVSI